MKPRACGLRARAVLWAVGVCDLSAGGMSKTVGVEGEALEARREAKAELRREAIFPKLNCAGADG